VNIFDQSIIPQLKEKAENANRSEDKGLINEKTGSSILIKKDGNITLASGKEVQYKLDKSTGKATEISFQSTTITNRKKISTDEIIVNNQKMNPKIYELSNMKELNGNKVQAIGHLNMTGTVLVKTWEPTLKKYVLMRRQVRMPIFYPSLNDADAPEAFSIDTSISINNKGEV